MCPQERFGSLDSKRNSIEGMSVISNFSVASDKLRFRIVAPAAAHGSCAFARPVVNDRLYDELLFGVQLVRGSALKECGNISTHLLPDGRHYQEADAQSWHIVAQNESGRIMGCARYRPLTGGFEQLGASQSALAYSRRYGPILRTAVEELIAKSWRSNKPYGEAGGWALRPELRGSTAAVNIALMTLALGEILGVGGGITTATRCNHSASILQRIGAKPVAGLPAYYEPKYGSVIEIVHWELPCVEPRIAARLAKVREMLLNTEVIFPGRQAPARPAYQLPHLSLHGRAESRSVFVN